jgi:16S rRNA (guanine527-N7)-methyltransferase
MSTVSPEDRISSLLNRYCDEIERFNPAYGLVKVSNREELFTKHINDSLAPLELIKQRIAPFAGAGIQPRFADAGSGAGLPGIPLAICMPGVQFTLIERMSRRAGFLRNTIAVLGLTNVKVEECGIEKAAPGRFHGVCFRAVWPLEPGILKSLFRLLAPQGFLAAYKGRREKINAEIAAMGLPDDSIELHPLAVPGLNEERHLLIINRT